MDVILDSRKTDSSQSPNSGANPTQVEAIPYEWQAQKRLPQTILGEDLLSDILLIFASIFILFNIVQVSVYY